MDSFLREASELKKDTGLEVPPKRVEVAKNKIGDSRTRDFEGLRKRLIRMRKMYCCKRVYEDLINYALGIKGDHIRRFREMQQKIVEYDEIDASTDEIDDIMDIITVIIENYELLDKMRGFYQIQVSKFTDLYSNYAGRIPDNITLYYNKLKSYGFRDNNSENLTNQFIELKEYTNRMEHLAVTFDMNKFNRIKDEYQSLIRQCEKSILHNLVIQSHRLILENVNQYVRLNPLNEDNTNDYKEKLRLIDDNLNILKVVYQNGDRIVRVLDELQRLYSKCPPTIQSYFPEHNTYIQTCCNKDYSRISNSEITKLVTDSNVIKYTVDNRLDNVKELKSKFNTIMNNYDRVKSSLNNSSIVYHYNNLIQQMKVFDNYNDVTATFINTFQSKLNDFEEVIHFNESKGNGDEALNILIHIQEQIEKYENIKLQYKNMNFNSYKSSYEGVCSWYRSNITNPDRVIVSEAKEKKQKIDDIILKVLYRVAKADMEELNIFYEDCRQRGVNVSGINMREIFPVDILDDLFERKSKDISFYEDMLHDIQSVHDNLRVLSESSVTTIVNEISSLLNSFYYKYNDNSSIRELPQLRSAYDEIVEWVRIHNNNNNTSKDEAEETLNKMKRLIADLESIIRKHKVENEFNKLVTKYPGGNDSIIPEHQQLIDEYMNMDYHKIDDNQFERMILRIRNLSQVISSKIDQSIELSSRINEIKQKYQNCRNRGIILQDLDVYYNKLSDYERKIRKYEINNNDIQNIDEEINSLSHKIDEKEEEYNNKTKIMMEELAGLLQDFYSLGCSKIVRDHIKECNDYFEVYESVNSWFQSHQADTISKQDVEEKLKEMKKFFNKLMLQSDIWELSSKLNKISELIKREKQKYLNISYSDYVNNCELFSKRLSKLDINRSSKTEIRNLKTEVEKLENNLNGYIRQCDTIIPILENIKSELNKIYGVLEKNRRRYNLEKEITEYRSLNTWFESCNGSNLAKLTKESCDSKLNEAKQITESLIKSIQEGKKLENCHKDRVDELQKFITKINKSKYNVSLFKSKCNEIQKLLNEKTPLNSGLDDYIKIKNDIDELVDKFCAFTEERKKVQTAITNMNNKLSEFNNLVETYPTNLAIKNNSPGVENISKWLRANTINSNSPLSEYGKRLSQLKEILQKVNDAIDASMRQEQLVKEINIKVRQYKNNKEVYNYLNQLLNKLKNISEVNNVQRNLSELENCYEKKQIIIGKINKFCSLFDYLSSRRASIDADVKRYYNSIKSDLHMFDLSNNTLESYEAKLEDIKRMMNLIKQNVKIYQMRLIINTHETQIYFYSEEYNHLYPDEPIAYPESYNDFTMSHSIYRAQESNITDKMNDSINRFNIVYHTYHNKILELQENIKMIMDNMKSKYSNNFKTISKLNSNALPPTFYQDFTAIIDNPSNSLTVCNRQYELALEYKNILDEAIDEYYSNKTSVITKLQNEIATLAQQVPILRDDYNSIDFNLEGRNTQYLADFELRLVDLKKQFIEKRNKYYNESLAPYYIKMYCSLYRQNYTPNTDLHNFIKNVTIPYSYERYRRQCGLFRYLCNTYLPCAITLFQILAIKDEKRVCNEVMPKMYNEIMSVVDLKDIDAMFFKYQNLYNKLINLIGMCSKYDSLKSSILSMQYELQNRNIKLNFSVPQLNSHQKLTIDMNSFGKIIEDMKKANSILNSYK